VFRGATHLEVNAAEWVGCPSAGATACAVTALVSAVRVTGAAVELGVVIVPVLVVVTCAVVVEPAEPVGPTTGLVTVVTVLTTGEVACATPDSTEFTVFTVAFTVLVIAELNPSTRPLSRPDSALVELDELPVAVIVDVVGVVGVVGEPGVAADATADPNSQATPAKPTVSMTRSP
jgi:hypothetical protein